jgi:catechol 2,3-dioxygenase-like lactoylglutathione lyase family enzyme
MHKFLKSILILMAMIIVFPSWSAQPPDEFARSGIAVGVIVEDIQKSVDFYTNVIGMVQVREFSVDVEKARKMGLSNGQSFDIKVLKLINNEDASEWKLMSFRKKSEASKQGYIPEKNGFRYVTIFVKSMKPVLERIRKYGVKTMGETPLMLDANRQFVSVRDPDGNFVELIGPK